MKKILLGVLMIMFLGNISVFGEESDFDYVASVEGYQPEEGIVPDAETAEKIAKIILVNIYGKRVLKKKPFEVTLDKTQTIWLVKGFLPPEKDGGVPYVLIQKVDGKVLKVIHTK